MSQNPDDPAVETSADRIASAAFGVIFVGIGVLILLLSADNWHSIAAVALGALGLEAVVSACLGKRSLLSRVGPLA